MIEIATYRAYSAVALSNELTSTSESALHIPEFDDHMTGQEARSEDHLKLVLSITLCR